MATNLTTLRNQLSTKAKAGASALGLTNPEGDAYTVTGTTLADVTVEIQAIRDYILGIEAAIDLYGETNNDINRVTPKVQGT
jgi:hypothetical protein